jgi:23S rRNA (adenine1618-N6)-methyltransferase
MAFHPRNRHQGRYDFQQLTQSTPELTPFVSVNAYSNEQSIDFANPQAVKALNRALLKQYYGISKWDIPSGYLCPPIPGRADLIHTVADLLSGFEDKKIPRGKSIRVLDIGVGANCIYPLIGHSEYGWSFVGTETDSVALDSAENIVQSNPGLRDVIEFRKQATPDKILKGMIDLESDEKFDLTICNPPYHASLEEARQGTQRKWKNLGKPKSNRSASLLNFGGQSSELWCEGGEFAFIRKMIQESVKVPNQCLWFTTLVSKSSHLSGLYDILNEARVYDGGTLEMTQGQKKSRIIAWTFLNESQQKKWRDQRFLA